MIVYTEETAGAMLASLSGWEFRHAAIEKTYQFRDFVEAWGFMTRCAILAERADHHPEWSNVYRSVHIRLSTHDAGGVTTKDFDLASKFEAQLTSVDSSHKELG